VVVFKVGRKSILGRVGALRRPDAAARHPYQKSIQKSFAPGEFQIFPDKVEDFIRS
jgi:hypothetical protein